MILKPIMLEPKYIDTSTYAIKCANCGKFISRKQIKEGKAKYRFIPDSEFGPEEAYWKHVKC